MYLPFSLSDTPTRPSALCLLLFFFVAAGCAPIQHGNGTSLTILHTNDVHAVYGGFTAEGRPCYEPFCAGGAGGSVRLEEAVRIIREQTPDTLLLDAGDEFQGTLFYTVHKEKVPAFVLPRLGYAAMTPGNHEFDEGCDLLRALAREMNVPIVAANLELPGPDPDHPVLRPWIVVEKDGRRIGIVGLVTPSTPMRASPCAEARFSDPETALRRAVTSLTAQGVDIIIALTHLGLAEDRRLAQAVDGVDVIVGGHSHSLLSNTDPKAVGPYPVVEVSPSGAPVLVVTAAYGGRLLGRLNVTFDDQGKAAAWNGAPILLDDQGLRELAGKNAALPDPVLVSRLEAFAAPFEALTRQAVGSITAAGLADAPNALVCRVRECVSGNVLADAMLDRTGAMGAQAALFNGGGVRNPLVAGENTVGDLLAVMPFENLLLVGDIPGRTLWAALEHGVSHREEVKGQFLQVAGLRYVFDPALPKGKRLLSADILDPPTGAYRPIRPDGVYRIVTTDYLGGGRDGFAMLAGLAFKNTGLRHSDVLRAYLERKSPLAAGLEGRITIRDRKAR